MNDFFSRAASLFFECGMLARFKRSGLDFLGGGDQNIASHVFRTAIIGYVMAKASGRANPEKTAALCLFHDLPETRTGDINLFQSLYVKKDEAGAARDMFEGMPDAPSYVSFIDEFNDGTAMEAIFARDADVLELIITLKEEADKGNREAPVWIENSKKRLVTDEARRIAEAALNLNSGFWWHGRK